MKRTLKALITAAASIALLAGTAAPAAASYKPDNDFDREMIRLINVERTKRGIPALKHSNSLRDTSVRYSQTMSKTGKFEHDPRLQRNGESAGCKYIGENIYHSPWHVYSSPKVAMEQYMNSPGHRANILNRDYTHMGVGTVRDSQDRIYNTQRFAYQCNTKKHQLPPATPKPFKVVEGKSYLLNNSWGGAADINFVYGKADDVVFFGDWNGDGKDTPAIRRGNLYYITNSTTGGAAEKVVRYGRPGDEVLVGDWNGDGKDTFAVRRGSTFYIKNSISGGDADRVITYGRKGDTILAGDWNGDGKDTFAVRRGSVYHVKNSLNGGKADHVVNYGRSNDTVLVGDWDGDGKDTFGVRRGKVYHLRNSMTSGPANRVVTYGRANDEVLVGDWNGNGVDTLGVRR